MTNQQPARSTAQPQDNLIGICSAVGEDFAFNPFWLRLTLGALFVLQPVGIVVCYVALGVAVLISRLVLPTSKRRVRVTYADVPHTAANEPADETVFAKAA